ncbi:MAG: adenylate/guanylate cyclase domain-containing protein [Candidatus Rokubacteria bacterium]|nr:adenylate/guanylate cyclase domain-containing protein [Candidatus Rokubacteria bacterium]
MMNEPPEIRYAASGVASIAYQAFGEGPAAIVHVPGLLNHIETTWAISDFAQFFRRLAGFTRVALFDKLGTGLSDRLPAGERSTLEQRAEDVVAVMDAIGLQKAAVFGTADGGPVAAMFAASYPQRTDALILYGTWARLVAAAGYPLGYPETVLETSLRTVRERWGSESTPLMLERLAPSLRSDSQWRRSVARMERLAATPSAAVSLHRIMFQTDIRAILPVINVPTLVLHVSGDRLVPIDHGHYLAANIPGARLVELGGSDHLFFRENGDTVASLIHEFLTGTRLEPETSRILATVLFTDIVGSTQKAAVVGDRCWAEVLERYHEQVRAEILRHNGRVIDIAGDGVFAVFTGPGRAIRCAATIREVIRPLQLELRAGVHTGEMEAKGDRVSGMAVHIGARIAALAEPSEILVSRTVKDLVVGSGIAFVDRGTRDLKGVPEPWQSFAARL